MRPCLNRRDACSIRIGEMNYTGRCVQNTVNAFYRVNKTGKYDSVTREFERVKNAELCRSAYNMCARKTYRSGAWTARDSAARDGPIIATPQTSGGAEWGRPRMTGTHV